MLASAQVQENEVYSAIGEEGFERLISAFYKQIPSDDILGPIYPKDDWAGAEERLRDFLIYRFGGPARYIENRGHPRLRMRHAPFPVDLAARNRWLQLRTNALEQSQLPTDVSKVLMSFFESTATAMMNRM